MGIKYKKIMCPKDTEMMDCFDLNRVFFRNEKTKKITHFMMPRYRCKICGTHYTSIRNLPDMKKFYFKKVRYTNLCVGEKMSDLKRFAPTCSPFIDNRDINGLYQSVEIKSDFVKKDCYIKENGKDVSYCVKKECTHQDLIICNMELINNKMESYILNLSVCPNCGTYYIFINVYEKWSKLFNCLNLAEIPRIMQKNLELELNKNGNIENKSNNTNKTKISMKDFVIRRSVLSCIHNKHRLQDIDAIMKVISWNGDLIEVTIPAGYCSICDLFFILEEDYEKVLYKGIPACKVTDERTYENQTIAFHDIELNAESLLKMYGYSVSQKDNLTSFMRKFPPNR